MRAQSKVIKQDQTHETIISKSNNSCINFKIPEK